MTPTRSGKTRSEPRQKARIYWQKARRFAHAAATNALQADWDPAVANAANAVINLADALCVHYGGSRSASGSHFDVLNVLAAAPDIAPMLRTLLSQHLEGLLNFKALAQYEGRLLEKTDADKALKHMERAFKAADEVAKAQKWTT